MTARDRYAVIGDPVSHSLSPAMQNAAFERAGIAARYDAERVASSGLDAWVKQARRRPYAGFNVTIPHKEHMPTLLDCVNPSAERLGAVNTVVSRDGRLHGYNTDVEGFEACLRHLGADIRGSRAVVLGAGGSARAVVDALARGGAHVTVAARTLSKAHALAVLMEAPVEIVDIDSGAATAAVNAADVLVNATPVGMKHLPESPLPPQSLLRRDAAVVDLVYGVTTPLIIQARGAGCITMDGIEMLVQQGAASFRLWTGLQPDIGVMRTACHRQLAEVQACSAS